MHYTNDYYEEAQEEAQLTPTNEIGCKFCWDARIEQEKELVFFDPANNLRTCKFCPWCGRAYQA